MSKYEDFFEYIDMFGTKPGFYIDRKAKYYTVLGGILSLIALCFCLIIFVLFSISEFKRMTTSITTTSSISTKEFDNINITKEKIYIPFRIIDEGNKFVNHTELIYPLIEYIEATKENLDDYFNIRKIVLNYTLCNETSMINLPNNYYLTIPLNQLYCIDIDKLNLDIGGYWISLFIKYLRIKLFLCENGDEKNKNYTNSIKLIEKTFSNHSLYIEFFYPSVQFQPKNLNQPVKIVYKQYYYGLTQNMNKLDRLFLQRHILSDDIGWFVKNIKNSSYLGYSSLIGDYYLNEKDIFNTEVNTSLIYTLCIYLDSSVILYTREYKKFIIIFTECLPIMYIMFIIIGIFAKIFKFTEETKMILEFLFENLKEKHSNFQTVLKRGKIKIENRIIPINDKNNNSNLISKVEINVGKNKMRYKSNEILPAINHFRKAKEEPEEPKNENIKKFTNNNSKLNQIVVLSGQEQNEKSVLNLKDRSDLLNINLFQGNYFISNIKKRYVSMLLFPYRNYFYSLFIKNTSKLKSNNCCFSKKFIDVYKYLAKIFDVTTYLSLQREFHIFKTQILDAQKLNIIQKERKININDRYFFRIIQN